MQATSPAAAPAAAQPPAQDGFVPISQLPADEHVPAAPLLIAAYALVWIILAVYVWTLWRRFQRAERDVQALAAGRVPPTR
jgi:CcmD family protein